MRFEALAQCCWIEDASSNSGVFVNGNKILPGKQVKVFAGDLIRFGHFEDYLFRLDWAPAEVIVRKSSDREEEEENGQRRVLEMEVEQLRERNAKLTAQVAQNEAFTNALLESLECPVCLEVKLDLHILRCGHSICASCARNWGAKMAGRSSCVVCNTKINGAQDITPSSFVLNRIIAQIQEHKQKQQRKAEEEEDEYTIADATVLMATTTTTSCTPAKWARVEEDVVDLTLDD